MSCCPCLCLLCPSAPCSQFNLSLPQLLLVQFWQDLICECDYLPLFVSEHFRLWFEGTNGLLFCHLVEGDSLKWWGEMSGANTATSNNHSLAMQYHWFRGWKMSFSFMSKNISHHLLTSAWIPPLDLLEFGKRLAITSFLECDGVWLLKGTYTEIEEKTSIKIRCAPKDTNWNQPL